MMSGVPPENSVGDQVEWCVETPTCATGLKDHLTRLSRAGWTVLGTTPSGQAYETPQHMVIAYRYVPKSKV